MRVRRPLAALCALAPLVLAATACSDSSAGNITGTNGTAFSQTISNPSQAAGACHSFAARGVSSVANNTAIDIVLHKGPHCTDPKGRPSHYLPTTFSANTTGTVGLWRSFSTVGWPPPVPVN